METHEFVLSKGMDNNWKTKIEFIAENLKQKNLNASKKSETGF